MSPGHTKPSHIESHVEQIAQTAKAYHRHVDHPPLTVTKKMISRISLHLFVSQVKTALEILPECWPFSGHLFENLPTTLSIITIIFLHIRGILLDQWLFFEKPSKSRYYAALGKSYYMLPVSNRVETSAASSQSPFMQLYPSSRPSLLERGNSALHSLCPSSSATPLPSWQLTSSPSSYSIAYSSSTRGKGSYRPHTKRRECPS